MDLGVELAIDSGRCSVEANNDGRWILEQPSLYSASSLPTEETAWVTMSIYFAIDLTYQLA